MPESKLTTTPKRELSAKFNGGISDEQFKLITDTIMKGATAEELAFFGQVCERTSLDPFLKQIHPVKRWNNELKRMVWSFQVGIDGFRAVAQRTGAYDGSDDAIFDDETKQHPNKATVTVWKLVAGQHRSFTASARYAEYVQLKKDQTPNSMWQKMPYGQLAKCAEALALRKAFPEALSGLHTDEEMAQADNPPGTEANNPMRVHYQEDSKSEIDPQSEPETKKESDAVEVEVEPVESPELLPVPEKLKNLVSGGWKSVEIEGKPLARHKVHEIRALQSKAKPDAVYEYSAALDAAIIDETRAILASKSKTEAELACADPDVFDEFPAELWSNRGIYQDLRTLAESL